MEKTLKFDSKDCLKQALLRKIPKSKHKSQNSINAADKWLEEAKKNFSAGSLNSCLITCYLSMFHAARSILFKDGYREKSHACIARYLEDTYVKKGQLDKKFIDLLDHHREIRHQNQYGFQLYASEEDCKNSLDTAEKFLNEMRKLVK